MDITHQLIYYAQSITSPLVMVLVLAIVFALDPCLTLTNIAAIGYIGSNIDNKKKTLLQGLYYTLGRTLTYGILGCTMIAFLQMGKSLAPIKEFIEHYGNTIIIVFLIATGILICIADHIPGLNFNIAKNIKQERFKGAVGAFLLGAVLSFAFCPTNAVLFFGMMVPACSASNIGYILPFVFAFATAIPVIFIAIIMAFSLNSIARYYNRIQQIGRITKWIVGIAMVAIGITMICTGSPHEHEHEHEHEHLTIEHRQ